MAPRLLTRLAVILCAAGALATAGADTARFETVWFWSGAVTSTSAEVKARVRGTPGDLHLVYGPDSALRDAKVARPAAIPGAPAGGVAAFGLSGLSPNTDYYYAVSNGTSRSGIGHFRTFPDGPLSFSFAFSSCAGGNMLSAISNHPIFDTIRLRQPLFFLHQGDFHYSNIGRNDIGEFRRAYDRVLTQPRQGGLYQQVPIAYMWDDHDYGPNDSDRTSPARSAARLAYAENVPHYPLVLQDGQVTTIQQQFTVGRVPFVLSDLRSERDPSRQADGPGKSIMGARQRAWLDETFTRLAKSDAPLIIWVSSVPWITREGDPMDGWQPYSWERQWIADRLEALGLTTRLVMLAGDAHMAAIDDGRHSNYASGAPAGARGFPVIKATPLDRSPSIKGGPYSHGISAKSNQFGWADIKDDGHVVRAVFSAHDAAGRLVPGLRIEVACGPGGCQVVP
jgi:alkaline phosphatase D